MKRKLIVITLLLLLASSVFAFDYKLELFSFKPTYKEYTADRSRASLDFQYAAAYKGYPDYIYQEMGKIPFNEPRKWRKQPFLAVYHIGESLSAFRNTLYFDNFLSPISFDLSFQGGMTNVMEGRIADLIGFDGNYFLGVNASIADKVVFRYGISHYCTHYGDGVYKQFEDGPVMPSTGTFDEWFKYLRMNSMDFGLSVYPISQLRLFTDINFNTDETHVRPFYFSPNNIKDTESVIGVESLPSSYNGFIISFGAELELSIFKNLGTTTLAYTGRAYEEGRIVYKDEDLIAAGKAPGEFFYDKNRPWEFEHTICISQKVSDIASIDVTWHHGRFILNSFYATRTDYISIGGRLDFDRTFTLFDTNK